MEQGFFIWVVYDRKKEHPNRYMAKKFKMSMDAGMVSTNENLEAKSLTEIRSLLPRSLYCIPRAVNDSHQVVEVWF